MGTELVSRLLFGRAMRLPILIWIRGREDPVFYQGEVHTATKYPQSAVAEELTRFDDLGLVAKQGRVTGRQYYLRQDQSALWDVVDAARLAIESAGGEALSDNGEGEIEGRMLL